MPKVTKLSGPSDKLLDPDFPPDQAEVDLAQEQGPVAQEDLADAQPQVLREDGEGVVHDLSGMPPGELHLEDGETAEGDEDQADGEGEGEDTGEQVRLPSRSANKPEWEDALSEAGVSAEWVLAEGRTKEELMDLGAKLRDDQVYLDGDGMPAGLPEDD